MGETAAEHQLFRPGDRVRVRPSVPDGNPRTPGYLRGWAGTVVRCHGVVDNPLDHHQLYPPLYSVLFTIPDDGPGPRDEVLADIHEEWLAPVDAAADSDQAEDRRA